MSIRVNFDLKAFKNTPQSLDRLFRYVREQANRSESDLRREANEKQFIANVSTPEQKERFLLKAVELLDKEDDRYRILLELRISGHPDYPKVGRWSYEMIAKSFGVTIESVKAMESDAMKAVQDKLAQLSSLGIEVPSDIEQVVI